jgi:hypothetical protein
VTAERSRVRRWLLLVALALVVVFAFLLAAGGRDYLSWRFGERRSVADRLAEFGPRADDIWRPLCAAAGLPYPPPRVRLLALKKERLVEVFATDAAGSWRFLKSFPVLAASGGAGPKLREGDGQVPEGLYRISALNPNSLFHVSLRVDYPNAEDRAQAALEGRQELGGDIMIHGGKASIGCIALGDPAIEEVFTLAARSGIARMEALILPADFLAGAPDPAGQPAWMAQRYGQLRAAAALSPAAPLAPR